MVLQTPSPEPTEAWSRSTGQVRRRSSSAPHRSTVAHALVGCEIDVLPVSGEQRTLTNEARFMESPTVFNNLTGYRGQASRRFNDSGYRVPVSSYMGQVRSGSSSYSHAPLLDRSSCHTDHHRVVLVHGLGGSHLEAVRALTRVIIASRTMSCRPLPRRCAGTHMGCPSPSTRALRP